MKPSIVQHPVSYTCFTEAFFLGLAPHLRRRCAEARNRASAQRLGERQRCWGKRGSSGSASRVSSIPRRSCIIARSPQLRIASTPTSSPQNDELTNSDKMFDAFFRQFLRKMAAEIRYFFHAHPLSEISGTPQQTLMVNFCNPRIS